MLGNEVRISYAALKDIVSIGYHNVVLVGAIVFAYRIQGISKPRKVAEKPVPISPYGRPLISGGD
jgi:hypothetical protein